MNSRLNAILGRYFREQPLRLVDVGAAGGLKKPWDRMQEFLHVFAFEPSLRNQEIRKTDAMTVFPVGLSDTAKKVDFHITKHGDGSSILQPHESLERFGGSERFQVIETSSVQVDALDNLICSVGNPDIDFLKIDTQGTELDVLRGSVGTIQRSVLGIEIEVNFFTRYRNQAFFSDVDAFLRDKGFLLFDISRRYSKYKQGVRFGGEKGQLMKGDALYLSSLDRIRAIGHEKSPDEFKRLIVGAIAVSALYGYLDYAHEVFRAFEDSFSEEERKALMDIFEKSVSFSRMLPSFPGRFRISILLNSMARLIKKPSASGSSGDDDLGNV